jgi:glycosyltransferase involved in cell wall biosynthesis
MSKIAIISDTWLPKIDGIVRVISRTKRILENRGVEVIIIHPGLFATIPLFFYKEFKVSLCPSAKIRRILEKEKPDYIHIATEGPLGFSARRICVRDNIPFTTQYHTHLPLYVKLRVGRFFNAVYSYMKWFHAPAHRTIVGSESLKEELEAHGFEHLVVSALGVDHAVFRKNEKAIKSAFAKPVFVYLGRIAIEKNVEDFLACELPGTKLVIGDGPMRKKLERKHGKNNVFVGYKKGQDLVDLLSASDVFVYPSRSETFGLIILEALSCGLPVAAYDVMGPKDIITHGVDGHLGEDLAFSAIQCLRLSPDACRKKALSYSWDRYVEIFLANQAKIDKSKFI